MLYHAIFAQISTFKRAEYHKLSSQIIILYTDVDDIMIYLTMNMKYIFASIRARGIK